jgi:ABC-type dipeptide/oligopeptide/nickel transport system permease component
MTTFILRRLIWTVPVILLVILMTFVMMRQISGNPFRRTERAVPQAIQRNLDRKFNLDKPWYMQYLYYVKGVAKFDYGPSLVLRNRSVNDIIKEHFPKSIQLGLLAFVWAILLGVPAGIIAALRPNSIFDYGAMLLSNVGFAVPNFLVATLLIYYMAVKFRLVPTNGWPDSFWDFADKRVILPSFALGLFPMAYFARLVRGTMLETLQQDYVRTAKAKGLRWRRIVGLHVFRNSLIPVVTAAGPLLGYIITGSFVIETIFSIPGIGRYYIDSVEARDYSVVMGVTVLLSLIIIAANLAVDILYGFLDPRTRDARA